MVIQLEPNLSTNEYELERMVRVELVGYKWKRNHRLMEDNLKTAKKDLKVAYQILKELLEKQKAWQFLALATVP